MTHDVFISYSSKDKAIADAVCAKLENNRIRCWIAPRDILPGVEYGQALVNAIKTSRAVVLVLSSNSNVSPQVMREIERAVSSGIPIIPLRIEDITPSESMEYYLSSVHWLDAITPPIEQHLDKLTDTVVRILGGDVSPAEKTGDLPKPQGEVTQPLPKSARLGRKPNALPILIIALIVLVAVIAFAVWGLPSIKAALAPDLTPTSPLALNPTASLTPPPGLTPTPTTTSLPTNVVIPIEEMASSIPWLPSDPDALPETTVIVFNTSLPPFNDPLVRRALAAAVDRQVIAQIAEAYGLKNLRPATSLTPALTLGLDLYGQVGIPYDPDLARTLLAQAGYEGGNNFPATTIVTNSGELRGPIVSAVADMWKRTLSITIKVEEVTFAEWSDMLVNDLPPLVRVTWPVIDNTNDPDYFLRGIFHTGITDNKFGFSNSAFDNFVDQAAQSTDPAKRQDLYVQAERILCEEEVQIIPLYSAAGR